MASSRNGVVLALVLVSISVLGRISLTGAQRVRYDGYQVWRVQPQTSLELNLVDSLVTKFNLSYWLYPSAVHRPIDFMVEPHLVEPVKPFFQEAFAKFQVLITDVQQVSDEQVSNKAKPGLGYEYGEYHPLEEIEAWMDQMVEEHGDLVTKQSIGKSYEGREINYLKISTPESKTKTRNSTAKKQAIFIQGGIHAREWISPATVTYMTNQLLKQYEAREAVKEILTEFDWYVLPVFNVDGYTYTWTTNRLWRKTRSPTIDPNCVGVDPNRNWDNHWCESGASKDPCSELYCGGKPFSEVEVLSVSEFLQSGDFRGFIDFHSYSQLWMTPWAWTVDLPVDFEQQYKQSEASVNALEAVHGTNYRYGTIANELYEAAGSSIDWTYADAEILYSATVELRDTGRYGFLLPPDQIIPTGEETLEGLIAFAQYMLQ